MEDSAHPTEMDPHPRTASLGEFCTEGQEQLFDIAPLDVSADGFFEESAERFSVFVAEGHSVNLRHYDKPCKFPMPEMHF